MNRKLLVASYGVGVWALPFMVGMMLFPLQQTYPTLFDTAMVLMLVLAVIVFSTMYQKKSGDPSQSNMIAIGFAWMAICLLIDVPLFLLAFGWDLKQYIVDIGAGYPIIPLVTGGMAKAYELGSKT